MADYIKHFEIYDGIFRIRLPGYDPGPGPGNGTFGGLGKNMIDVIVGDKFAAVWDTGYGDVDLKGYIEQHITMKPLIVFNSHGHIDHARGNAQFDEVWIHEADVEDARRVMSFDMPDHPFCEVVKYGKGCTFRFVEDGQIFDLGGRTLTIHFAPGHSPGSITAVDSKCRVMFSGDAVLKRIGLARSNGPAYKKVLEKLKVLETFDVILGSHWDMPMDKEQIDRFIGLIDNYTPDKAVPAISTLGGRVSHTHQIYVGTEFADPEFAAINIGNDLEGFLGKQ